MLILRRNQMQELGIMLFIGLIWLLLTLLQQITGGSFPQYFCDGSKRIVLGEQQGKFWIQILRMENDVEFWDDHLMIKGWAEVKKYVRQENEHQQKQKKALKIDKRE